MSMKMAPDDLKLIGESCSQYQMEERDVTAAMGTSEEEQVSCETCRNWSGSECVIDAFDNVAVNLGILEEE